MKIQTVKTYSCAVKEIDEYKNINLVVNVIINCRND